MLIGDSYPSNERIEVSKPTKYQTIPQEVEVVQYTEEDQEEILRWLRDNGANVSNRINFIQFGIGQGWVDVKEGQYIIKPIDGRFYVVDDIEAHVEEAPKPKAAVRKPAAKKES